MAGMGPPRTTPLAVRKGEGEEGHLQREKSEADGVSEEENPQPQGALFRLSEFCSFQAGLRIWLSFLSQGGIIDNVIYMGH